MLKNLKYDALILTVVVLLLAVAAVVNFLHDGDVDKKVKNLQVVTSKEVAPTVTPIVTATPSATLAPTKALYKVPVKATVAPVK